MKVRTFASCLGAVLVCLGSTVAAEQASTPWRVVKQQRGVVVSVREEPGKPVPSLRAQATIQGSVVDVLAVVLDDARASEWAKGSTRSQTLRRLSPYTQLVYTRSDQPWPVQDRDVVMRRSVQVVRPAETYRLHMVCAPEATPVRKDAVRVHDCESTVVLRRVDDKTTAIDYRISLDPGGSVPKWLVRWTSERLPFDTVTALEKQVKRTRGDYDEAVRFWSEAR